MAHPTSLADTLRALVQERLVTAFERSRLTEEQVAMRAGVHPKTVRRVLAGNTCEVATVEQIGRVLGVRWRTPP